MKGLTSPRTWAALLALISVMAMPLAAQQPDRFNHETHEGLFPLCGSCHTAMANEAGTDLYPAAEVCARCHDGAMMRRVRWSGPERRASNLAFDHLEHAAETRAGTGRPGQADCTSCHRVPDRSGVERVRGANAGTCLNCHAHEAPGHKSPGRDCAQCHLPLTAAQGLTQAQVERIRPPASHGDAGFLGSHAPVDAVDLTSCQTCHARESCTRCHLNGADLEPIQTLGPDARVAALLTGKAPEYPIPGTHGVDAWSMDHGGGAMAEDAGCGNCHAQPSCRSCHRDGSLAAIAALPLPESDDPRGVLLIDPIRWVHPPQFELHHRINAAVETQSCTGCHANSYCQACHDAVAKPAFHFGNILQSHPTEAWGNQVECTACHNPELFCRACHQNIGLASQGDLSVAYHSSRPDWLMGHGAAARQGLESCRSCHSQQDCTRCHSSLSGWNINPHGPGFDAERAKAANPNSCLPCHGPGGLE